MTPPRILCYCCCDRPRAAAPSGLDHGGLHSPQGITYVSWHGAHPIQKQYLNRVTNTLPLILMVNMEHILVKGVRAKQMQDDSINLLLIAHSVKTNWEVLPNWEEHSECTMTELQIILWTDLYICLHQSKSSSGLIYMFAYIKCSLPSGPIQP
jgi:hypothetical protein